MNDKMKARRKIRVLIAKPGLDGHDRGAKVVARGLMAAGMEVIYLGLRNTLEQISEAAAQEDVDVVALSCLSGAHMALLPKTVTLTQKRIGRSILFVAGGIIPAKDVAKLKEVGVAEIFGPGTTIDEIREFIENHA